MSLQDILVEQFLECLHCRGLSKRNCRNNILDVADIFFIAIENDKLIFWKTWYGSVFLFFIEFLKPHFWFLSHKGHFSQIYLLCSTQKRNFSLRKNSINFSNRNHYSFTCYVIHLLLALFSVGMSRECISLNRSHSCVNSKKQLFIPQLLTKFGQQAKLDKTGNVFQLGILEACGRALLWLSHLFQAAVTSPTTVLLASQSVVWVCALNIQLLLSRGFYSLEIVH